MSYRDVTVGWSAKHHQDGLGLMQIDTIHPMNDQLMYVLTFPLSDTGFAPDSHYVA